MITFQDFIYSIRDEEATTKRDLKSTLRKPFYFIRNKAQCLLYSLAPPMKIVAKDTEVSENIEDEDPFTDKFDLVNWSYISPERNELDYLRRMNGKFQPLFLIIIVIQSYYHICSCFERTKAD